MTEQDLISLIITGPISLINPLTPNDHYSGCTAPLTSKRCSLCIYSTNIGTEYFKHGIYSPFFSSSKCSLFHNSNVFGSCIIHILYTGYAKIKKNNSGAKRLIMKLTGISPPINTIAACGWPDNAEVKNAWILPPIQYVVSRHQNNFVVLHCILDVVFVISTTCVRQRP